MLRPLYFPGRVFRKHGFIDCIGSFCAGALHELPEKKSKHYKGKNKNPEI